MRRRELAIIGVLALALSMGACILDPSTDNGDKGGGGTTQSFQNLTQKWHVLNNLELSYLQRDIVHYKELLDPADYTFYFTDVVQGNPVPATMDRDQDVLVTTKLFTEKGTTREVVSLDLTLEWENATWVELPPDPQNGRNESWWTTTVNYSFTIKTAGGTDYVTFGTPRAQFTVRQDAKGLWHLVEWRDLGSQ